MKDTEGENINTFKPMSIQRERERVREREGGGERKL